jgi:uncharacterized protein
MRVPVADIRKSTGLSKNVTFNGRLDLPGVPVAGDLRLELKITNAGSRILLEGQVEASVTQRCSRCAEDYQERLLVDIDEYFVPVDSEEARQGGPLDEVLTYENDKLELVELLRQELLAALPMQSFCRPDCKGLCSGCGINLNLDSCKCTKEEVDPRWAALLDIKENKTTEKRRKDRPRR